MEVEGGQRTETPSRSDADRLVLALASLFSLFFDHISALLQYRCKSFAPVLALGVLMESWFLGMNLLTYRL